MVEMGEILVGDIVKFVKYQTHDGSLGNPSGPLLVIKIINTVRGLSVVASDKRGKRWMLYLDEVKKIRKHPKTVARLSRKGGLRGDHSGTNTDKPEEASGSNKKG